MTSKFYLTTAIPYVNDRPHLGHAYEAIGTDALARFHRQRGADVFFLTGTDENATKNEEAARKAGMETRAFVDQNAARFQRVWDALGISYDRFIRTTDADHIRGVQEFVRRWIANGDVYLHTYEGWYCVSCEAFYEQSELIDGRCRVHTDNPDAVRLLKEDNYFFRLTKYQERLKQLYASDPEWTLPASRRNEVLAWLDRGLKDISVSRGRSLNWGVPWPNEPAHTVYVWFDALINYVTGIGFGGDGASFKKWWPADVHVIGKDITRFHCIYWPAMLMAADIELPKRIFVHGFLEFGGQKMSKSAGNMIDPVEAAERLSVDGLRFLVLREAPFDRDSPISAEALDARFNAELANGLGNTVQRTLSMLERYREGRVPDPGTPGTSEQRVRAAAAAAIAAHDEAAAALRFSDALGAVVTLLTAVDQHYQQTKPWQLAKDPAASAALDAALYAGIEAVRIAAILLWPYLPGVSARIAERLSQPSPERVPDAYPALWGGMAAGTRTRLDEALFPRLESAKS